MYHPENFLYFTRERKKSSHRYNSADTSCCRQHDTKLDDSGSSFFMPSKATASFRYSIPCNQALSMKVTEKWLLVTEFTHYSSWQSTVQFSFLFAGLCSKYCRHLHLVRWAVSAIHKEIRNLSEKASFLQTANDRVSVLTKLLVGKALQTQDRLQIYQRL